MLKPLNQVTEPDERYAIIMAPTVDGGFRPIQLLDHYADIAAVDVGPTAPEEVGRMFERARHAYLYSWFEYELSPLAEQQAFATLEHALRLRLGLKKTLGPLVEKAVAEGIIPDDLFTMPLGGGPIGTAKALSMMRNNWAHGSTNLSGPAMALGTLKLCADLIVLLFPTG